MNTISVQDIQADPLAFFRRVAAGEAFVVVMDERPVGEVRPVPPRPVGRRPYGLAAGQFRVPADFNDPLPDNILDAFEADNIFPTGVAPSPGPVLPPQRGVRE